MFDQHLEVNLLFKVYKRKTHRTNASEKKSGASGSKVTKIRYISRAEGELEKEASIRTKNHEVKKEKGHGKKATMY